MFKKMLPWLLIVLVAITLIISGTFVLWNYLNKKAPSSPAAQAKNSVKQIKTHRLSAKQVSELTVKLDDITTNLANKDLIKIGLAFQMSNVKAVSEFKLLTPQIDSEILATLSDMTANQISGSKGMDELSSILMNKLNPMLQQGKIVHVDITSFILPG